MGIEGLTRHNIASHLQKYRSHRKHLLSREAEAATWSQRRRMYGGGSGAQGGCSGVAAKRVSPTPWLAPTMGFPPPPPMHHFRQLHVWGHPTADHAMMHMWPRQPLVPSRPHLAHWPPPPDPSSFWHSPAAAPPPPHPHYPKAMMHQVTPCLTPQPVLPPATRLATKAVGVVPPQQQVIYNNKQEAAPPPPVVHRLPHLDLLPSNETIDAALGDILSKPWLPLPLGLKPPSTDSVLSELQRQGISRVPPSCA